MRSTLKPSGGTMKLRILVLIAVLVFATLVVTACGGGASQPSGGANAPKVAGDAAKGKTKFEGTCASCHGNDAKGLPGLGKDLTTSTFVKGKSDADLIAFVKAGRPASDPANTTKVDMPPKGGNPALTDADLADITAFIRTVNK
jgi:disulfide bond formation protein DsbB